MHDSSKKSAVGQKDSIIRVEAIGLILLCVIALIATILRYWGHIPWGAR